jgi:hypothetical protein
MVASAGASLAWRNGARRPARLSLLSRFCQKVELIGDKLDLLAESGMIHVLLFFGAGRGRGKRRLRSPAEKRDESGEE